MKSETRRIFIGDLPEDIKDSDLREKFSKYGQVSSTEVKQRKELGPKNRSLFFAFVGLEADDSSLQRCFQDFNSKKWKGQYVELQMAKESFLTRLNKEREEAKYVKAETKTDNSHIEYNGLLNNTTSLNLSSTSNCDTKKSDLKKVKLKKKVDDDVDVPEIIIKSNRCDRVRGKLKIESVGNDPIIKIEAAKPKSKDPKRAEADSRRIKSMMEMKKGYQQQKLLIKNALSKIDVKPVNKIVFHDVQNSHELGSKADTRKAKLLFDDDDEDADENVDINFEVKEQFQGKKGQKLLELQSRYKQDERFALSSRFLEDDVDEEDIEDDCPKNEVANGNDEKQEQLMILEKVLGRKISVKEKEADDDRKKRKTMLRFDPAHPDHVKYEVKSEEVASTSKKRKRKTAEATEKKGDKPVVSKEIFYEVAGDLKDALNVKESFSLLDAFGTVQDKGTADRAEGKVQTILAKSNIKLGESNPFKYDSSDDESDNDNKRVESDEKLEGVASNDTDIEKNLNLGPGRLWTEPFFFKNGDSRLQEGVDFIRKVQAEDTIEFSKVRRDLVEIVKAKVKNNQQRNRPFKKKLGGRKMLKIKRAIKR